MTENPARCNKEENCEGFTNETLPCTPVNLFTLTHLTQSFLTSLWFREVRDTDNNLFDGLPDIEPVTLNSISRALLATRDLVNKAISIAFLSKNSDDTPEKQNESFDKVFDNILFSTHPCIEKHDMSIPTAITGIQKENLKYKEKKFTELYLIAILRYTISNYFDNEYNNFITNYPYLEQKLINCIEAQKGLYQRDSDLRCASTTCNTQN